MSEDTFQYLGFALIGVVALALGCLFVFLTVNYSKERPYEAGYAEWVRKTIALLATHHPLWCQWDLIDDFKWTKGLSTEQSMQEISRRYIQRQHWAVWGLMQGYFVQVERNDAQALRLFVDVGRKPLPAEIVSPFHESINHFNELCEQHDQAEQIRDRLGK